MQHRKSKRRKLCTVCVGLRGTATFISGLVGEETLKVVSVYTLCSDVDVRDHIDFLSKCVCVFFFLLLVYFQSPAPLSLIDIVQTLHFKGGTLKSSRRREKVFFFLLFLLLFLLSVQFYWRPKGCTGWQVESPGMASVVLTNESYQKVNKQQRLYEKWHKWKRSRIAGWHSAQDDFSCLFPAHGRVTQWRTALKVTQVTEPIKTKTSQTCLESNLSRTWGHSTQVRNCGTLWQQQHFPFPCLPLTLCFSRRWEESCLFYVMVIIMWRGWESLAFQSKVCVSDTFECA